MNPVTPIDVTVSNGAITKLALVNDAGTHVTGAFTADRQSWHSTEDLGYGKTYTLTASALGGDNQTITRTFRYTTLTPANMTMPYLQRPGGYALDNGATYGVGIVPVVHFDEPITDKAAVEKNLIVTSTPHVDGVWDWVSDTDVHFRPHTWWASGTKVTVTAKVYGVDTGGGIYGQSDVSTSFRIGRYQYSVADDKTHMVTVYVNDKPVRKMPTSMGRGGYVQGKYGQIALWTMSGVYTVLEHDNPAIMSSDSYGLPANSPAGYGPEPIYYATKISVDGIYLHELDATVWAQGSTDVSHGCLNLNHDNAQWYYQMSQVGDPVRVINTTGPAIQQWQNGDWSVPWTTWKKGSALH
jgi:lipoprotein-anchoring transpeptidase ErfK/SrfK